MSMDIVAAETIEFCESCHVGRLLPYRATYAHWHEGEFIVVPGVPAWRCDYCGDAFYDNEALARLVLLLGPESVPGDHKRRRTAGLEGSVGEGLGDRRRV
jgi:YgiT-type zinc finger domain-containing protein